MTVRKSGVAAPCSFFGGAEVRFTTVEYMPHATMTEMSCRIWNEIFFRFQRDN